MGDISPDIYTIQTVPLDCNYLNMFHLDIILYSTFSFRVCLELNRTELSLNGGVMLIHTPQSYIHFDQHRIVSVEQLVARFPHSPSDDDQLTGRGKFKDCLLKEGNQIM